MPNVALARDRLLTRDRALARHRLLGTALVAFGLGAALPVSAHHSFALFDHANRITVTGTVAKFEWTSPHVLIELAIPDGVTTRRYTVECASPTVLMRMGWKLSDIKLGDKITLLVNPLRDGQPGGMLESALLADGRRLSDGNPPVLVRAAPPS